MHIKPEEGCVYTTPIVLSHSLFIKEQLLFFYYADSKENYWHATVTKAIQTASYYPYEYR